MADLGINFNAEAVEPSQPFDVIPSGKYVAQIVQSEMRMTSKGDGQYLWMEIDILEGKYAGRKLWDRLNLVNDNQEAVDISQRTLSAICHATGKMQVSDSEQLHCIPMLVTVRIKPAGPDKQGILREAQNTIGGYEALTAQAPSPAARATTPARTATTAKPTVKAAPTEQPKVANPPWRRNAAGATGG